LDKTGLEFGHFLNRRFVGSTEQPAVQQVFIRYRTFLVYTV